jgi:phage shock protein E
MKKYFFISFFWMLFSACSNSVPGNYSLVKPAEFATAIDHDKNYVLLDVRTPEEFAAGSISNAININFHDEDFSRQIAELDRNTTYYIYCRSGNRSHKASKMMQQMDFKKVIELDGGIVAWQKEGMQVK